MKVVQIISTLAVGGAENQVVNLLNGFNSTRIEKYLICFDKQDTPNRRILGTDVNCFTVRLKKRGQFGCIFAMFKLFRRIQPDVVQAHMFHTNLYVVLAAKMARVPVVLTTEHGKNLWKNVIHHFLERLIITPFSTMRIAVSKDILRIRVQTGDVPERKIMVITPCVEIPDTGIVYRKSNPIRIGAVGRMVGAKDYTTLLKAVALVVNSGVDIELIFIGDGPERAHLETLVVELGLSRVVHFPGFQADVNEWLRNFDVVVFSSVREGIPVAMLEAMAIGVPIIATRVGGIPEVIDDCVQGLIVAPQSPEALSIAIVKMASDPLLRKNLGLSGRERVSELFNRSVICQQYEKLYYDLLRKA